MPYQIRKVPKGWKVFTKGTDRSHSNDPLPLARAKAQLKALYANADESELKGGMIGGFDDGDFERLFGMYGGVDEREEGEEGEEVDPQSQELVKSSDLKDFDVEDATGEPEYLKIAKQYAKKAGYKDWNSLKLAVDGKHKLELRGVKFGSINNNDYIIYRQHFPSIADTKRKQYLARACKIKGNWAKDKYSPNSLAISILWDGSSKKGGDYDWAGLVGRVAQEGLNQVGDSISDFFKTPEELEKERLKKEACKLCNEGKVGGEKKMNYRKDDDYQGNWGYDEDAYLDDKGKPISKEEYDKLFEKNDDTPVKMPVEPEYPEQPLFGDPSQFQPQAYDPNNPLMYMVGGAIPINKKLYEKVKAEVYPRYKKPSAYRSGAVVKRYKELGGKFREDGGRPLARWFKEEWKDVGNQKYPVYRPTKRISKDTPLTPAEIDPENLQLQISEKQKIRGEQNLKPFEEKSGSGRCCFNAKTCWGTKSYRFKEGEKSANAEKRSVKGGRLAQTDVQEEQEAKKILNKVAGEGNPVIKDISETPMGDDNIRQYLPGAKVLKYSELADIDNIEELLPRPKTYFFLLYEQSFNRGHFVVVNRYIDNGKDTICFFCSYGSKIDAPLYWNSQGKNRELGQDQPYLSQLLQKSGKNIQYNRVQYQSKKSPVATCGAFATLWIKANMRDNMNLQDFHDWISEIKEETGLSYDAIASNAISAR
jgi:hypothetical protein